MENNSYILMLEGDPIDRELSKDYFAEKINLRFLQSSSEVLPFLIDQLSNHLSLPKLIILSLHSVPDTGLKVLEQVKTHDGLKHIPVIVLGENTQPGLIKACYENGANTFIKKPFTNAQTEIKIKSFLHYWLEVAELSLPGKVIYS
jgi:CheY-like chemotaxis protein